MPSPTVPSKKRSFLLRLFSSHPHTLKQASTFLAFTALLSNALGLLRNIIFYRLVAPAQLDIYYASFRVADLLFNLLIFGAITSAFIPVISDLVCQDKEEEAKAVTNQLLTYATIFFLVMIFVLNLFMQPIIELIVPHFGTARLAATISLSRLMLLQTIFFSWSFILGGLLNSYRRFSSYALAPLVYNIAIIIGGLFAPKFGIIVISYGVILGSFLHFMIQFRETKYINYHFKPDFRLTPSIKQIFYLMIPRSFGQGMNQLVLTVYTNLASGLKAGSIAIFSGMNDLQTTPSVIVGNSLATAILPTLSSFVSAKNWPEMNKVLTKVVRISFFLLIPTITLGFILRAQIVRLYFGIGGANWTLTTIAISTFVFFLLGIIPAALVSILARVFYAFKNTRTPMLVSIGTGIVGISISIIGILHYHLNVSALALAESCISLTQFLAYLFYLERAQHVQLFYRQVGRSILDSLIGSILSGLACWLTLHLVNSFYLVSGFLSTTHTIWLFLQSVLAASVGICIFFGYSMFKQQEEIEWLKNKTFFPKI